MLYKPLEQTLGLRIASFQPTIIDPFIEQLLANQIPSFETTEVKRRRQEEFQITLISFCKNKLAFEKVWQQYIQHLKNQIEEDVARDEKNHRERRIQENKEIEKRSPTILIEHGTQQIQEAAMFEKLIEKSILYISAQIKKSEKLIEELTDLEKSIKIDMNERTKKIKDAYQVMAITNAIIEIPYARSNSQGKQENAIFKIHIADIINHIKESISSILDEPMMSQQISNRETDSIERFVDKKLELESDSEEKSIEPSDVVAIKKEVTLQVQEHQAKFPEEKTLIQNNLAALAVDQVDLMRVSNAKECSIKMEEQLAKKREALLLKKQALSKKANINQTLATSTETSAEKSILKTCHNVINDVKHDREKIAAVIEQPSIKPERVAANSSTYPKEQQQTNGKKP
ncbi:MAG TPA: hypothetical protein VLI69_00415 [Gammaproteobacteria bacterium]|nr:hypothetical protein [Gammaproteobacteria bacterium]